MGSPDWVYLPGQDQEILPGQKPFAAQQMRAESADNQEILAIRI
jgi:hypothetical protein